MALIYYVEDDQSISYIIEKTIQHAGYHGLGFVTGEAFLEAFKKQRPQMILLDVMLPDVSGLDLLKIIRKMDSHVPVMMVSALQTEMDKVIALDLGADDYLTKPFGVLELASRIQAKLRKVSDTQKYVLKNVTLDIKKHVCSINHIEMSLTNKEFSIFKLLLKQQGDVVSKETIFKEVWDTDYIGETRTLDMHIKSLRQKLSLNQSEVEIKTVRGVGYQVE